MLHLKVMRDKGFTLAPYWMIYSSLVGSMGDIMSSFTKLRILMDNVTLECSRNKL